MNPEEPGKMAQCDLLARKPVHSPAGRISLDKTQYLGRKRRCEIRGGRRIQCRCARHEIRLGKSRGLPDKLDFGSTVSALDRPRPVCVRRPSVFVGGVAMPVDGIAKIRHPLAETENPSARGLGCKPGKSFRIARENQAANRASGFVRIGKGEFSASAFQEGCRL